MNAVFPRLILIAGILLSGSVVAATFSQTDWSDGVPGDSGACSAVSGIWTGSECIARDPANAAGWTAYSSKDTDLSAGADLTNPSVATTLTQTTNADFAAATNVQFHTTHSDFSSGALLTNTKVNNGAVGIKPATLVSTWTAKTDWNFSTGTDYDHPALADLDGDGDLDMLVGQMDGDTEAFRNIGSDENPSWESYPNWRVDRHFEGAFRGYAAPMLGDFDGDGDTDMFLAFNEQTIYALENTGTKEVLTWTRNSSWDITNVAPNMSRGAMANLDGTGYPEMLIGGGYGHAFVYVFQYDGATWSRNATFEPPAHTTGNGFPNTDEIARAAVGDLDDDGDIDLLVGYRSRDTLVGFENTGDSSSPTWSNSFNHTLDVADSFHSPVLVDLDSDGDLDFFTGSALSRTFFYYENVSTTFNTSGTYTSAIIDTGLGNAGYTTLAYSILTPANTTLTIDIRSGDTPTPDGSWTAWQMDVSTGADISALGNARYVQYRANLSTADTSVTPLLKDITINYVAYPNLSDVYVANNAVSLNLVERPVTWDSVDSWSLSVSNSNAPDNNNSSIKPALGDLNNDGALDLLLGDAWNSSAMGVYLNDGANNWTYTSGWNLPFVAGTHTYPALGDLDGDGDLDVLVGANGSTTITAYENTGGVNGPPGWTAKSAWNLSHTVGGANAELVDLDNDGDLDAMVSHVGTPHEVHGYENQSIGNGPVWARKSAWDLLTVDGSVWAKTPALADLDGDGDYDLLVGDNDGSRQVFENVGNDTTPSWNQKDAWLPPSMTRNNFAFADLDADGDQDILIGSDGIIHGRKMTGASSYDSPGTYISAVMDFAFASLTTLDYTALLRTDTSLTVDVRAGNTAIPDGSWTAWQLGVADGGDIFTLNGNRYLQYRVNFTANGTKTLSPEFQDITVNYNAIPSPLVLTSSAYDSGDAGNFMLSLDWTQSLPTNTDVRIQLRTAPDNAGSPGTWTSWMGPDGGSSSYWNSTDTYGGGCSGTTTVSCTTIPTALRDGSNDQWFQYQVTLVAGGGNAPTFSDIDVGYTNALPPGVSLNKTIGLATTEAAGDDTFTVVLDSLPTGSVTISLSHDAPGEIVLSDSTLTFTTGDWNVAQTVTVTGVNEFIDDGDQSFTITLDPSSGVDSNYNALASLTVTGTNEDNDSVGVTLNPPSGLQTTEAGTGTDTFTVVLDSQPTEDVTVNLSSSDVTEGTVSPSSLTFTPGLWNSPKLVTVTGVDEGVADGNIGYAVVTSVASSNDPLYNGLVVDDASVTNLDDDSVSVDVVSAPQLTTTEAGGDATFTIALGSEPTSNVYLNLTSSNGSEGTVSPSTLTFTDSDWDTARTITVTGQDDNLNDGDVAYTVIIGDASSADSAYDGLVTNNIPAVNQDNDAPAIIASPLTGLSTNETGTTAVFGVVLSSEPSATVNLNVVSNDVGEGTVSTASLSFHPGNWYTTQSVTVTGSDDVSNDGDVTYTITVSPAIGGDVEYNSVASVDVSVTNIDDESSSGSDGFTQTDWRAGIPGNPTTCAAASGVWLTTDECSALSPDNQGGWQAYLSKDSGLEVINSGADLTLPVINKSLLQTNDAHFSTNSAGVAYTTYDDFATDATLSNAQVNNGAVGIKPATLTSSWTAKTAWDFASGVNNDHPALADLDGDGDLDMLVGQNNGNTEGYRNIGSDIAPVWESYPAWRVDRYFESAFRSHAAPTLGDFDGDGDNDLFLGFDGNKLWALENTGSKMVVTWTRNSSWDLTNVAGAVTRGVMANLDGSSYPEMVTGGGWNNPNIYVFQYDGATWSRNSGMEPQAHTTGNGFPSNEDVARAAVGDLNGDGDTDLLVGYRYRDTLVGLENTGNSSSPTWSNSFNQALSGDRGFYAPVLIDLDSDGDLDFFVGSGSGQTLFFYENDSTTYNATGTFTSKVIDAGAHDGFTTIAFTTVLPTNTTLTIDIGAGDTAVPDVSWTWLTDVSSGGDISALAESRYMQYRANLATTDNSVTPLLTDLSINFLTFPSGSNVVATDGKLSLKLDSQTFAWDSSDTWTFSINTGISPDNNVNRSRPALGDLDGDGIDDMLVGDDYSATQLGAYKGTGSASWTYQSDWNVFHGLSPAATYSALGDIDGDGDLDAYVAAAGSTRVYAHENTAGPSGPPVWFRKEAWDLVHSGGETAPKVALADLDSDGDLDALVGVTSGAGLLYAYENQTADDAPVWVYKSAWNVAIDSGIWNAFPSLADFDLDGDYDVIVGDTSSSDTETYENIGSSSSPAWNRKVSWDAPNLGTGGNFPLARDLDGDGAVDLLIGSATSTMYGRKNVSTRTFPASGSFTSSSLDFGSHLGFTTVDFDATLQTGTALSIDIRAGNTAEPDGSWTVWSTDVSDGGDISGFGTRRYIQYRVNLTANGAKTLSPTLDLIQFNYTGVVTEASLVSSAFDTNVVANLIDGLRWGETLPANSDVRIQLRTAVDAAGVPGTWSDWVGPDGNASSYWNSVDTFAGVCSGSGAISCDTVPSNLRNGLNNQWLQYKVTLISDGIVQPVLSNIAIPFDTATAGGFSVIPTSGLTTTEAGGSDTFTIVMTGAPSNDVTVELNSGDLSEGTVSPSILTFTNSDWSDAQTVTVTGVGDSINDGDVGYTIFTSVSKSNDAAYNNRIIDDVTVTNSNNDASSGGVILSATSGLTTTETGGSDSFTIKLATAPTDDVTITMSSSDDSEGLVSPGVVVFNSSNWNVAVTVTVTGQDDSLFDQDVGYSVVTSVAGSLDPNYAGLTVPDVSVSNTDNEVADVVFDPVSGFTVSETGGFDTFTVKLASQPTADVKFRLVSSDMQEGTVFPFTDLTFTSLNWDIPQTATVYGVNDNIIDGDVAFTIATTPFVSDDSNFNGINPADFTATNSDDDTIGITVSPLTGLTTSENGLTAMFNIRANSKPASDVIIKLSSSDSDEGQVIDQVVLRPDDVTWRGVWVTVTGVDDRIVDTDQTYTIVTAETESDDLNYDGINPADVTITNLSGNFTSVEFGQANANVGRSVAYAGDVNKDGFDDVLVGAPNFDNDFSSEGRVMLYYGNATSGVGVPDWSLYGGSLDAYFGESVASAGDVNKDGYDDVIVGAPGLGVGGQAFIFYGSSSGLSSSADVTLDPSQSGAIFGSSVASAGDVNKDGYDDVIVGAPWIDRAYIYHGSASGIVNTPATTLVGQTNAQFGMSVASAVDVNNDGYDDVIVGADYYTDGQLREGSAHLYYGSSGGIIDTAAWEIQSDLANAYLGRAVAGVGDINLDGYDDLVIGAYGYTNGQTSEGRVFVYHGTSSIPSTTPTLTMELNHANAYFGYSVARGGDVNKDGYADIFIGAYGYDNGEVDEGRAYLYYGSASGVNATPGIVYESDGAFARLGISVGGNGDFNNDGYGDLVAGADKYESTIVGEGRAYIYRTPPQNIGVTVTPTSGLLTSESLSGPVSFTVVLNAAPASDVMIESFVGDTSEGTLQTFPILTFTPSNWDVPQTVQVAGVDDAIDDGDVSYRIINLARSADTDYDNIPIPDVNLVNVNDEYTVTVAATDSNVGETGSNTGEFTFTRTGPTTSDLTVVYSVNGTAVNGTDYASLTGVATIASGQSTTTVTVTPVDDAGAESAETVTLNLVDNSTYLIGGTGSASMTIVDNDAAGITVAPTTGLVTTEAAGSATFTVVLNTMPSASVTIDVSSNDTTEGRVQPSSLTFTTGNWNIPQTVTVVGQDDDAVDNDVAYTIETVVSSSGDGTYLAINPEDVSVTNADDDTLPNVSVVVSSASVVENTNASATFTLTRTGDTSSSLLVSYNVSGSATSGSDYQSLGASALIAAGASSLTLPVMPVDDGLLEGEESVIVSIVASSSYIVDQPSSATVIIADDEQLALTLANFAIDQVAGDGASFTVEVALSKEADAYPVTIPFTVSGTATGADHNAVNGDIVISNGRVGSAAFSVTDDGAGDPDETIIFTMGTPTNAAKGARDVHVVTIVEENVAPSVTLESEQVGMITTLVVNRDGQVTVTATIYDPNPNDTHSYDWALTNNNLVDIDDADPATFVFDPIGLLDGFYKVRVTVTDDGIPAEATEVELLLEVTAIVPSLSTNDTDGDGISDDAESYDDSDSDGIPDYLDASTLESNELQQVGGDSEGYVMRTDPGLTLRLGDVAFAAGADGAQVSVEDIANYGGGEGDPGTANATDDVPNTGGYFDFEVHGLPEAGQSITIVVPLLEPLPASAVYRKYDPDTGWRDFVVDGNNAIHSAPGEPGECPLPGDSSYNVGLAQGDYCVQLTIEDGGPNDTDGIANNVVEDPGQIVSVIQEEETNNHTSGRSGGSGGGSVETWALLVLLLFLTAPQVRKVVIAAKLNGVDKEIVVIVVVASTLYVIPVENSMAQFSLDFSAKGTGTWETENFSYNPGTSGGSILVTDQTPWLRTNTWQLPEIVTDADGNKYYHILFGSMADGFMQEFFIRTASANYGSWHDVGGNQPGSASGGEGDYFSASKWGGNAADPLDTDSTIDSGLGSGNPKKIIIRQVMSDGEMMSEFLKDTTENKPRITQQIVAPDIIQQVEIDMRGISYDDDTSDATMVNQNWLLGTDIPKGLVGGTIPTGPEFFDVVAERQDDGFNAGKYTYSNGTGTAESGGTYNYADGDFDHVNQNWSQFYDSDYDNPWGFEESKQGL